MARPTLEEIKRFESITIPRHSEQYMRIEHYSKASFLNNIIFEFFLRDEAFDKIYRELTQVVQDFIADKNSHFYPLSEKFNNVVEKYREPFAHFNYSSYDITSFLYSICAQKPRIDDAGFNMVKNNLLHSSQVLFPKIKQDISGINEPNELGRYNELFNIVKYSYSYPAYNSTTNNININVNLNLPQEVILEQIRVLLENIQTKNNNTINIRDLVGKKDINITFANYFYVYDHIQMGIPNAMIKSQIDMLQTKSSISLNTIKEHFKKMSDLFVDRNFIRLTIK